MLRGHAWAPDRPLARARPRQPRVHRPRRLHREGEADRANTRRAAGPKPAGGGGGFGCDQMAAAATMGRALRGRRAARVQRAARGPQAGHVLRLRARRCRVWPRARAATVAGARVHDRRDAGHLRRPCRGASKHGLCAPCAAAGAREARRRGYVVRTDRPRRAARARGGGRCSFTGRRALFLQGPAGQYERERRDRDSTTIETSCLSLRALSPTNNRQHTQVHRTAAARKT